VNVLFDSELKVPDDERIGQIKAREKPKLSNPFNADSERERRQSEKAKRKELEKPVWDPCIERVDAVVEDSVASMLATTTRRKLHVSQSCFKSVSTLAK
jgi:chorismate mutase